MVALTTVRHHLPRDSIAWANPIKAGRYLYRGSDEDDDQIEADKAGHHRRSAGRKRPAVSLTASGRHFLNPVNCEHGHVKKQ